MTKMAEPESNGVSKPGWFARAPVAAIFDSRLTDREFRVLCAVAAFMDKHGFGFPSHGKIAGYFGCTAQNILARLRKPRALGYLESTARRRPNGSRSTNLYRLNIPAFPPAPEIGPQSEANGNDPGETADSGDDAPAASLRANGAVQPN